MEFIKIIKKSILIALPKKFFIYQQLIEIITYFKRFLTF